MLGRHRLVRDGGREDKFNYLRRALSTTYSGPSVDVFKTAHPCLTSFRCSSTIKVMLDHHQPQLLSISALANVLILNSVLLVCCIHDGGIRSLSDSGSLNVRFPVCVFLCLLTIWSHGCISFAC